MGFEIERKFLVRGEDWRAQVRSSEPVRQGYLSRGPAAFVRVRRIGEKAVMTVKGAGGLVRAEFEYEIPVEDAEAMLKELCEGPLIEKTRHFLNYAGMLWTVDEFHGGNVGLVLAEIELSYADQPFEKPGWAEDDVTGDPRYQNAFL